jgi:hypothetical protein
MISKLLKTIHGTLSEGMGLTVKLGSRRELYFQRYSKILTPKHMGFMIKHGVLRPISRQSRTISDETLFVVAYTCESERKSHEGVFERKSKQNW